MYFEWDEKKNQANQKKHGISFDAAKEIFELPVMSTIDDRRDYGEERKASLGLLPPDTVIFVAHTERKGKTRLISARMASRVEREIYYGYIKEEAERDRKNWL